ncbi:tyrosine-type recombinase/integrase [Salmonella enterica]|nr:integrase [Salmonella enterica]ECC9158997.1 integrase [Salmonella enterica subsp. salamae]ECT1737383.1 integrase [Salmonella enterica subsp. enterica serovar Saintpaul]EEG3130722.1 tyrosine-type recombinase/integrase [Salmonella enterica subsp. enterica serovar Nima]EBB6671717.1 integrase [Salmonella enterica]
MRKYITESEWLQFIASIKGSKNEIRDKTLFIMAYEHGLRVSEIRHIMINDLDMGSKTIYIRRLKNGFSTIHPLQKKTHRLITAWLSIRPEYLGHDGDTGNLFLSQKGKPLSRQWIYRLTKMYSKKAGLTVNVHPHMFRHGCGYALADQGLDTRLIQDYLGHRNIHHTVRYTASNPGRFHQVWAK